MLPRFDRDVEVGSRKELFDPSQTVVELDTLNNSDCLQHLQQSEWRHALQQQRGHSILLKTNRDSLPNLHRWLVLQNIDVISLQPRHTLEDFFLQVTSGKQYVEAFTD